MLVFAMAPSAARAQQRVRPYEISPDARLPALSQDNMRLVPPTPEARVSSDRQSAQNRRSGRPSSPEPSTSQSNPTAGTFRRAPGPQAGPGDPLEYGRLIVVTGFDVAEVLIEGELYPRESMQGVLLWAGYQYEVVIQGEGSADSSSNARASTAAVPVPASSRTITVRLRPGETRVLMANLTEGGSPVARTSSSRSNRSRERDRSSRLAREDDDEEDIGYLGVSSTPRGTVYIDGDNIGQTTPARRIELEPGRHEVRIFYDSEDRFSETKNVLIRSGVNTNVFFRLRRDELEEDD